MKVAVVCRAWASAILSASFWRSKLSRSMAMAMATTMMMVFRLGVGLSDCQLRNNNWRLFCVLCYEVCTLQYSVNFFQWTLPPS